MKCWKFYCMEKLYPGLWQSWLRHQVVTVGWCSNWGYKLHDHHKESRGWNQARKHLLDIRPGDMVVAQLNGHRVGRIGEVVRVAVEDDQWSPLIPRTTAEPDGEQGRLVHVRWDLVNAPADYGDVVLLPAKAQLTGGLLRPTISELPADVFTRVVAAMKDEKNWASILPNFAYERSISDYIAAFPGRLEEGMRPYSSTEVRERIFEDGSRSDVLLLDRDDVPTVVECKQGSADVSHLKQLRHYMAKLRRETGDNVRGILVHGGAKKLDPKMLDALKSLKRVPERIDCVHYQLLVGFTLTG